MNVSLVFKWERDPDDALVSSDGTVKWYMDKLKPSDDDATAIACARTISEDTGGELCAVTIGSGEVGWALARGAVRAVSVEDYEPGVDDAETAAKIAGAVRAAGEADVVIMGDAQAFAGVAGTVAALLDLPYVASVSEVGPDPDNSDCLIAHRTTEGAEETMRIRVPALVSVAAVDVEKTVPTMKQMLAARKLPVDVREAAEIGEIAAARMKVVQTRTPVPRKAHVFEGPLPQAADGLVAALRADGVL